MQKQRYTTQRSCLSPTWKAVLSASFVACAFAADAATAPSKSGNNSKSNPPSEGELPTPTFALTAEDVGSLIETMRTHYPDHGEFAQWVKLVPKGPVPDIGQIPVSLLTCRGVEVMTSSSQEYWLWQNQGDPDAAALPHLATTFKRRGRYWYAWQVLRGGPGWKAGLLPGDKMLKVAGRDFQPVFPTASSPTAGAPLPLIWQRLPWGPSTTESAPTLAENWAVTWERLFPEQIAIVGLKGRNIAIIPLFIAPREEALKNALVRLDKASDGLVVDLRGGAGPLPAHVFSQLIPGGLTANPTGSKPLWQKPLVLVVDDTTRGDREHLARLWREQGGKVVGSPTQGSLPTLKWFDVTKGRVAVVLPQACPERNERDKMAVAPTTVVRGSLIHTSGQDEVLDTAINAAAPGS